MTDISHSPDKDVNGLNRYLQRCQDQNQNPSEAYVEFLKMAAARLHENDPEWQNDNLEYDLRSADWILHKARTSEAYAQNIYAALCNIRWQRIDVMPILKDQWWTCSWRSAGGIVADMLGQGDYMDWYCSGSGGVADYDTDPEEWAKLTGFVPEGVVTKEVSADFELLGWHWSEWPEKD